MRAGEVYDTGEGHVKRRCSQSGWAETYKSCGTRSVALDGDISEISLRCPLQMIP